MRNMLMILLALGFISALSAQVYINELDYDQSGTDAAEFIELIGTSGASLDGYVIELVNGNGGAVYSTIDLTGASIPNDNIAGFGFYVIGSANVANVDTVVFTTNGIQNGSPDGILLKLNGIVVDGFSYEGDLTANPDFTPGMALTAEDGGAGVVNSIGRITLGFDNSNQDQFFALDVHTPSPGDQNGAHGQVLGGDAPPQIGNITRTPLVPDAGQATTISATITDDSDVTLAEVRYTINDGSTQAVTMTNTAGDTYEADIPGNAYTDADRVEYWIYAEDDAPQSTESPHENFFAGNTPIFDLHAMTADGVLLYDGYDARITGVAIVESGTFSPTQLDVYLQDNSGGINLFDFTLNTTIVRGNSYTVTGEVAQFRGKTEIIPEDQTTYIVDNGPAALPAPVTMTIAQFLADAETYEGMLIQILQVTNTDSGDAWPATGNANVEITDDGGISLFNLRIDGDTNIPGSPEPVWPVNVRGILTQFDNTTPPFDSSYQILSRDLNDIDVTVGIEPEEGSGLVKEFRLYSNYPNPFNPSTMLRFNIPAGQAGENVSLAIYNALGQHIATLVNEPLAAGTYKLRWNGRSDAGQAATSGVYFAVLEMGKSMRQVQKMVLMK